MSTLFEENDRLAGRLSNLLDALPDPNDSSTEKRSNSPIELSKTPPSTASLNELVEQLRSDMHILTQKLIRESELRADLETQKTDLENQIEDLTQSLFEEANKMVADARRERDVVDKKNDKLRERIAELASLVEIKEKEADEWKKKATKPNQRNSRLYHAGRKESIVSMESGSSPNTELKLAAAHALANLTHRPAWMFRPNDMFYVEFLDFLAAPGTLNTPNPSSSIVPSNTTSPTSSLYAPTYANGRSGTSTPIASRPIPKSGTVTPKVLADRIAGSLTGLDPMSPPPMISTDLTTAYNAAFLTKYIKRIQSEDIDACLTFPGAGWRLSRRLPAACKSGEVFLEPIRFNVLLPAQPPPMVQAYAPPPTMAQYGSRPVATYPVKKITCGLCTSVLANLRSFNEYKRAIEDPISRAYMLKFEEEIEPWNDFEEKPATPANEARVVCPRCRERLVVVCEFWRYLRMVISGAIRKSAVVVWREITRRRWRMWMCRNGIGWRGETEEGMMEEWIEAWDEEELLAQQELEVGSFDVRRGSWPGYRNEEEPLGRRSFTREPEVLFDVSDEE
jgi:hypothetical protein